MAGDRGDDQVASVLAAAALERARAGGPRLLMVIGRELSDLSNTFPHIALFDRVVEENGAVLLDPLDFDPPRPDGVTAPAARQPS